MAACATAIAKISAKGKRGLKKVNLFFGLNAAFKRAKFISYGRM